MRGHFDENIVQDDWYKLARAAEALGMSAVELHNLKEPARTYWYERGLIKNNIEAQAARMPTD